MGTRKDNMQPSGTKCNCISQCKKQGEEYCLNIWGRMLTDIKKTKEICLSQKLPTKLPEEFRAKKDFPTGSSYEGTWNVLGMSGTGIYTYPNGVVYKGEFRDGMFHGKGEMRYPSGITLKGTFENGTMVTRKLVFAEGIEHEDQDWKYCKMPDRRFAYEYAKDLKPAGCSVLTEQQPTPDLPPGSYDCDQSIYKTSDRIVTSPDGLSVIRSPSVKEQKWIQSNCRVNPVGNMGPRPDLYEEWLEPNIERVFKQPPAVGYTQPAALKKSVVLIAILEGFIMNSFDRQVNRENQLTIN